MHQFGKKTLLLFGVCLIIGVLGIWVATQTRTTVPLSQTQEVPQLKEYVNQQYHFSFQYPSNYVVHEELNENYFYVWVGLPETDGGVSFFIHENENNLNLQEWLHSLHLPPESYEKKEMHVSELPAQMVKFDVNSDYCQSSQCYDLLLFATKEGKIWEIKGEVESKILNTFKFTE